MVKLGLIVFANNSGLGAQTRRLTYMLKPDRILAIDSSGFSKNKEQHFDWYDGFDGYLVKGFPNNMEIRKFMQGLTDVLVCENPLNLNLMSIAERVGVKVYIQSNYEFCDHLNRNIALPYKFLMPSYWHVDTMKERFGDDKVMYLPPPIDPNEFKEAREENFEREGTKKFLHIVGTLAANDRNGTLDLLNAVEKSQSDYEIVIRSQQPLPDEYMRTDHRIKYRVENAQEAQDMYADFDALILPRRYAGLSLTTNEALMSGLPVFMPDISPNNELLPKEWLYPATFKESFVARVSIDVYQSDIDALAEKIDWIVGQDMEQMKVEAFDLGYNNFSDTVLRPKYEELFNK